MDREYVRRVRRAHVVRAVRRQHVAQALRAARAKQEPAPVSDDVRAMKRSLVGAVVSVPKEADNPRAGMDRLLAKLDAKPEKPYDWNKYDLRVKPQKKVIRTIVDALGKGCEHCLNRPAVIYNHDFMKYLCQSCEEGLLIDAGACVFEKLSLKLKKKPGGK